MKKTITLFSLALMFALMVTSAAAATPTVSEVRATQIGGFVPGTLAAHTNDGEIFFYSGEMSGTITLDILSTPVSPDYSLAYSGTVQATINKKTDEGIQHYTAVWSLKQGSEVLGTFEGVAKGKSTTYLYISGTGTPHPFYSTNIMHCVLQGSGEFDGQTLHLDGIRPTYNPEVYPPVGPANPVTWEGTLMTR
jgi:hypothetical protein